MGEGDGAVDGSGSGDRSGDGAVEADATVTGVAVTVRAPRFTGVEGDSGSSDGDGRVACRDH